MGFETRVLEEWGGVDPNFVEPPDPTDVDAERGADGRIRVTFQKASTLRFSVLENLDAPFTSTEVPLENGLVPFLTPRIAVDADDRTHIFYAAGANDIIEYRGAREASAGTFVHERVDSNPGGAVVIGPAFKATGKTLVAAWLSGTGNPIMFGVRPEGGAWATERLEYVGSPVGLSVLRDAAGNDHITFFNVNSGEFVYAHRKPGEAAWKFETIASASHTFGMQTVLTTASNDLVEVALPGNRLQYGRRENGIWHIEDVEQGPGTGHNPSAIVDACNRVFIAYVDHLEHHIKLSVEDSGVWSSQVVAPIEPDVNTRISLVSDANGRFAVLWWEATRMNDTQGVSNRLSMATANP